MKRTKHRKCRLPPGGAEDVAKNLNLITATREGNVDRVEKLLKDKKIDVNVKDDLQPNKPTPLLIACENRHVEIARHLVRHRPRGADVNIEGAQDAKRPIWWAAQHCDAELAEILTMEAVHQCDVNYVDKHSGCSPLYKAILTNSTGVVRALVRAKADVNHRRMGIHGESSSAETPLIKAVQQDSLDICTILVNALCDLEAKTTDGLTALHYAVGYRRYGIAELLMKNRANVHAKTNRGATPMTVAIEQHNALSVRMLIQHGYNMNKRFKWGETPLDMCLRYLAETCAMTLVHWGCSLKRKTNRASYFSEAVNQGLLALAKLLIAINPRVLQENWVWTQTPPIALYRKPDFCEWLWSMSRSLRSLQEECRSRIWKSLYVYQSDKVKQLPVPEKLKDYIGMKEYFPDALYSPKDLDKNECPYDCMSTCLNIQCPGLDINSDSEYELDMT